MAIDYQSIENTIGYKFNNRDLLQQAFVRRSYSEENGGQNNEVLEFIGDKALDLAVVILMMTRFGRITEDKEWSEFKLTSPRYFKTRLGEGKFTDIKKMLVQKNALAQCMDRLGFHSQLIMGDGDISQGVQNQASVKEDLFEAIIGAVALDSDWDLLKITYVVDTMLDLNAFFNNEDFDEEYDGNYVSWLQEWTQSQGYGLPDYFYKRGSDDLFYCYLTINGDGINFQESGCGTSHAKARADVAYRAFIWLSENGYIKSKYENAVGEPIFDESTRQINELYQKKMIGKPIYEFRQEYDEDGNPYWYCILAIDNFYKTFEGCGDTKKESQRDAGYDFLCYIMGIINDE